jgi:hypothetical protein
MALRSDRFHRHRKKEGTFLGCLDELGRETPIFFEPCAAPVDGIPIGAELIGELPRRQTTGSFKSFDNQRLQILEDKCLSGQAGR